MATRGVEMTLTFTAWDAGSSAPKTGDSGNFTLRWVKDGTASAPTNSAAELDATNCPGIYTLVITSTEADATLGCLAGKSSTADVSLIPTLIQFERLPNAAPGGSGGVPTADGSNHVAGVAATVSADVVSVSGDGTAADNLEADYDGTGYNKSASTIGTTTANTDMRGTDSALLAASAPSNFADLAITASTGKVTVGTNDDKTGYSVTGTVSADVVSLSGDSTAADNLEADYDGSGYNKSASTIGTTTTNTDMRGTDSAFLAASAPSNFGDLEITASTGRVTVGTNSDKTGYSISGTLQTLDALNNFDPAADTVANVTTAGTVTNGVTVSTISDGAIGADAVADIWSTTALAESYASDGSTGTGAQLLYQIQQALTEFAISSTTVTVKKLDGSTTASTYTLDDASSPTSRTRAS